MKFLRFLLFLFFLAFFGFTFVLTISGPLRQNFFEIVDKLVLEMEIYSKDVSFSLDDLLFSNDEQATEDSEKKSNDSRKNVRFKKPGPKAVHRGGPGAAVSKNAGAGATDRPSRSFEIISSAEEQAITANDRGGFIFVQSIPEKGRVSIDEQDAGYAPVTVKVREPGDYKVGVQIKYYEPYELIVRVDQSEVSKVSAYLRMGKGLLTVVSNPQEATVTVDGKVAGKTPLTIRALTAGEHQVYVQKEEKEYSGMVEILPGDSKVLNVVLKQMRTAITVHSEPANADIYINGIGFGKTPHTIDNIKAGRYQLILEKNGSRAFVDSIRVDTERENVFGGRLIDKKHYRDIFSATLQIYSGMEDVFVRINNVTYGEAPLEIKNLRSGEHKVLLVKGVRKGSYYYITKIYLQPHGKRVMNVPKEAYQFKKAF
jgi:hypothetical protein